MHDSSPLAQSLRRSIGTLEPPPAPQLEKWVTESFGGVPARKGAAPGAVHHAEANRLAFTSEQLGLWYRVAPMRELRRLEMMWQVQP